MQWAFACQRQSSQSALTQNKAFCILLTVHSFPFAYSSKGQNMTNIRHDHKLLLSGVGFLLLLLTALLPFSPTAEAAVAGCRADPVIVLSDGTILDLSVDIGTNVANVAEIHYTVHGPSGVRLLAAIRTPTLGFAGRETFTYYADAQSGQYVTETLVRTTYDQVAVTSYTTFASATLGYSDLLSLQYKPISGFNNQILRALLRR